MAKVLLVEDDNNLREIYEARLMAEGYDIVSASDGEEALVVAKREQPDLVISDVMMPKISGFEMLDILRNTEGMREVKVIMLTALGQTEDQSRADSLGADRYLVKSQVTLEDIVNAAKELLTSAGAINAQPTAPAEPAPVVEPTPVAEPAPAVAPADTPVIPLASAPQDDPVVQTAPQMPPTPASTIPDVPEPVVAPAPDPTPDPTTPVEEPVAEPAPVAEPTPAAEPTPVTAEPETAQQEGSEVEEQIAAFVASQSGNPPAAVEPPAAPVTVEPETTAPETAVPQTTTTPEQEAALNEALADLGNDSTPTPDAPTSSGISGHNKVIRPISDVTPPAAAPAKSLDELVAAEAAKEQPTAKPAPAVPPVAPAPATPAPTPAPKPNDDFDPNSIAL